MDHFNSEYLVSLIFISCLAVWANSEDDGSSMKILFPAKLQKWNCTYGLSTGALNIRCGIYRHLQWTLRDFREWADAQEFEGIRLHLMCYNNGSISLRKPVGAIKLKELSIENCSIYNHYDIDITNYTETFQNGLRVLRYSNSVFKTNFDFVIKHILQWERMAKVAKCFFPESLEYYSASGCREEEINLESPYHYDLLLAQSRHEEYLNFRRRNLCHYQHLTKFEYKNYDASTNQGTLDNFFKCGEFPELEIINIPELKLSKVPTQLTDREWYFKFPKLTKIDLSRNFISEISFDSAPSSRLVSVNMSYNKISSLSKDGIRNLEVIYPTTIDFSHNEIECSCSEEFRNFLDFVDADDHLDHWKDSYRFLREEKCYKPRKYREIALQYFDIATECFTDPDPILNDRNVIIFICLLSVSFLLTCISVGLKFKEEIKILTFTRLKIKIGRTSRQERLIKEYDAFVSYSHLDEKWVNESLCQHLENSPPYFRLCLHHKHFIPGACISDNIIESVEKSRHTIIVLSDNFLQSEWCILEFRKAFHQSLLERKRHLIVIMLDEINQENLEPDMKHFLKTHTYLKKSEYIFWDKLIYALSDRRRVAYSRSSSSSSATYDVKLSVEKSNIPEDTEVNCT